MKKEKKTEATAEKKPMEKKKLVRLIIEITICVLFLAFVIVTFIVQAASPDSSASEWFKEYVFNSSEVGAALGSNLPMFIRCVIIIVAIYALCRLIRLALKKQMEKSNRTKTVITLLDGFIKYGAAIAIIIFFLKACGVNTTALIASVGILTLVIGLGAQSLIADVIAGMFIIFENEFNAGEIVSIDDFRGTVEEIGIRTTKVKDMAGNIKIINNSNISNVVNMSRELSLAVVDCEFPYDVPLEFIEKLMKDNLPKMKDKIPAIIDGPYYKGVSNYEDSNIAIKIVAQCKEEDRYQVQRDLLREYRMILVANDIDIAYPQVVIQQHVDSNIETSAKMKKEAQKFNDKQKELSADMDQQQAD